MLPVSWETVKPYVEQTFGGPKRPTRHDLILLAQDRQAPREVLEALQGIDYGMSFRDLELLQAYMLRQRLVRFT